MSGKRETPAEVAARIGMTFPKPTLKSHVIVGAGATVEAETRVSTDPDGFDCYSDHASDIEFYGACSMCGSGEAGTVGHVLPDVERVRNVNPVEAARMVLADQSVRMFDGMLLDLFTAQHIVAVHDALKPANQAKLAGMTLPVAASVCFRLAARQS